MPTSMQHGNIVSVLDLAREGDDVFLVMEFVDGPSLRQLIRARGAQGVSLGVATYIVQSAAAGLEFAHARPGGAIIHADISPSNLLLTSSGEVRVADFGIARREGLGHGVVEGKWAYMAPEQARGESLAPRSDVFALGVVMYELLTGQHPFGSTVTANERDYQMQVVPPRVVRPTVPHGLDAICMRALAHDPRARYGRMQQLIDALVEERFANGYRDGASDLANAIREVAPRADVGAAQTMHTERPLTIMTRSLLRELTPMQRPKQYGLRGPIEPAPEELTITVNALAVIAAADEATEEPAGELRRAARLPTGTHTIALLNDPTGRDLVDDELADDVVEDELSASSQYSELPSSGAYTRVHEDVPSAMPLSRAHTAIRDVDPAAQALLQVPAMLRVNSPPLPPFRVSPAGLPGDELASVVGGHTFTGRAPGVAVEPPVQRWTVGILAATAAVIIGIGAAIAVARDRSSEPAAVAGRLFPEAVAAGAADARSSAPPVRQPPAAAIEAQLATIEAQPATIEARPATVESPAAPAPAAPPPTPPTIIEATLPAGSVVQQINPGPPTSPPADPAAVGPISGAVQEATGATGSATDAPIKATALATDMPPARRTQTKSQDSPPRRAAPTRTATKPKVDPGVLLVQSTPWSWVTIGTQKKETPDKFYLPPGMYIVKFECPDTGVKKFEPVTIKSGERLELRLQMTR
jgi:hypothetical protein